MGSPCCGPRRNGQGVPGDDHSRIAGAPAAGQRPEIPGDAAAGRRPGRPLDAPCWGLAACDQERVAEEMRIFLCVCRGDTRPEHPGADRLRAGPDHLDGVGLRRQKGEVRTAVLSRADIARVGEARGRRATATYRADVWRNPVDSMREEDVLTNDRARQSGLTQFIVQEAGSPRTIGVVGLESRSRVAAGGRRRRDGRAIGNRGGDDDGQIEADIKPGRLSRHEVLVRLGLRFGRVGLAHRALRVDARERVDGLMADRAAYPGGNRRVDVLRIHEGRRVDGRRGTRATPPMDVAWGSDGRGGRGASARAPRQARRWPAINNACRRRLLHNRHRHPHSRRLRHRRPGSGRRRNRRHRHPDLRGAWPR
jgi:hypothetical protein